MWLLSSLMSLATTWKPPKTHFFSTNFLKDHWYSKPSVYGILNQCFQVFARIIFSLNVLIPTLSWIFIFNDNSNALNECLGKGYLKFFSTKVELCSNENQIVQIFCWTWLSLLGILMSNIIDVFCIFYCFKDINRATENSRQLLSNQAYINRKRYDQCYFGGVFLRRQSMKRQLSRQTSIFASCIQSILYYF